jgi:predicted nucleic acid-binding protein
MIVHLISEEEERAWEIAAQIAQHPTTNDPIAENHLGEAQVITLALRLERRDDLLLLDELAARAVAKQLGIRLSGFPGVLLLAAQVGLISPEELRRRLKQCRSQGTHYGRAFVQQVYEMAKRSGRR